MNRYRWKKAWSNARSYFRFHDYTELSSPDDHLAWRVFINRTYIAPKRTLSSTLPDIKW